MVKGKNIAILTNMVAPYRVPFFIELSKKVKRLDVLTCVEREVDRQWDVENSQAYRVIKLGGVTLNLNKGSDAKRILHFRFGIIWYLLRHRPDTLVIGDASWTSYIAAFFCKLFFINYLVWNEITSTSQVSKGIVDKLRRYMYRGSTKCIASCSMAEDYLLSRQVPKHKIAIVNNAVDNDFFLAKKRQLVNQRDAIRASLGIDNSAYVFIYVGQLISRKRVVETVTAIAELSKTQQVHLIVAGSGPLEKQMVETSKSEGFQNISFCGYTKLNRLCELYTASDALILLSDDEPWGMVVNEALLFDKTVYASKNVAAAVELSNSFANKIKLTELDTLMFPHDFHMISSATDFDAVLNPYIMSNEFFLCL